MLNPAVSMNSERTREERAYVTGVQAILWGRPLPASLQTHGAAKLVDKVKAGKAKLDGNIQVLEQLKATLVAFDPFFEVLPGTKPAAAPAGKPAREEAFEDDAPVVKEP